ncbi:XylR family transcriptional regulator [Paenibacillus nasutitermitis]|uniref:XylR family transcriptional regulator n=1 Tax=Paenibacillus nasutitermitis TaxID=1652958 RepID=A0A916ZAS8_9BACL|nr:DNA-binding transcriptional regulator [Paenibacillus nasutitermitis]GGD83394.1 XylR family transcriptional regulator [Paenibacillus nasutitermitis]
MNHFTPVEQPQKHVALLIETSNAYARGLLSGVKSYIRRHRPWSIYLGEHSRLDTDLSWLKDWRGDGIIARIENEETASYIRELGVPTVDLSASRLLPELPCVETNNRTIGRWAADHLLERGYKHFAYCGDNQFAWSVQRGQYFGQRIAEAGYSCTHLHLAGRSSTLSERLGMAEWVEKLPKPTGIMACYDITALKLLEACRLAGVSVPEEAAVIGVDNDELLCNLSDPPLSSIRPDTLQTGYRAAHLLDEMMAGRPVEAGIHSIDPLETITRMSTDAIAVEDKYVSDAVQFIRQHAYEDINVEDVLRRIPLSRRSLDSRFVKALGRTTHEEIILIKMKLLTRLLAETDMTLQAIAERIGFKYAEYMSTVFKKYAGISPGAYRDRLNLPLK